MTKRNPAALAPQTSQLRFARFINENISSLPNSLPTARRCTINLAVRDGTLAEF
jgi:hypothetical protein